MTAEKHFDREEEFAGLDFHSIHLEDRFIRTIETLAKQPGDGRTLWVRSSSPHPD
jgi:hypothetical protein